MLSAKLVNHKDGEQDRSTDEATDRRHRVPAGVRSFDDGVHEQANTED